MLDYWVETTIFLPGDFEDPQQRGKTCSNVSSMMFSAEKSWFLGKSVVSYGKTMVSQWKVKDISGSIWRDVGLRPRPTCGKRIGLLGAQLVNSDNKKVFGVLSWFFYGFFQKDYFLQAEIVGG